MEQEQILPDLIESDIKVDLNMTWKKKVIEDIQKKLIVVLIIKRIYKTDLFDQG